MLSLTSRQWREAKGGVLQRSHLRYPCGTHLISKDIVAMAKSVNRLSRDVVITNELGLHARSAARIAKLAQNGESKIWIIKDGAKADATSIIDILTLCCEKGSKITIKIDDQSDHAILDDLVQLVENGFGE